MRFISFHSSSAPKRRRRSSLSFITAPPPSFVSVERTRFSESSSVPLVAEDTSSTPRREPSSVELDRQLRAVERKNAHLKFTQAQLVVSPEGELRQREIAIIERQCQIEEERIVITQEKITQEEGKVKELQVRIQELSKFIRSLSEIGFRNKGSLEELRGAGNDTEVEETIVETIRAVSMKPHTIWHRVMKMAETDSAHPPTDYTMAIQRIVEDRVKIKQSQNAGNFWKSIAKMDGKNKTLVTPSHSEQPIHSHVVPQHTTAATRSTPTTAPAEILPSQTTPVRRPSMKKF